MLEENISERNGFARLMCGVAMTAIGTAHLARDSKGLGFTLVAAGAMKVAEGIFLYCPLTAALNSNVKSAVTSSFDEYMDGESLMQAFNASYSGSGQASSSGSSNSSNGGGLAQAATQVAGAVANAASQSPMGKAVTQAAQTVTNAVSGNNSSQQNGSNNNSTQSSQSNTGSSINPS